MPTRAGGLTGPALAAGAAAAGLALVALVDPSRPGHYPTCPFLALTGLSCPGCGSLRALHALAHGRVAEAVGLNALLVLVALPLLALAWVGWARRAAARRPRARLAHPAWVWALLALTVAFGAARNSPGGAWLAP